MTRGSWALTEMVWMLDRMASSRLDRAGRPMALSSAADLLANSRRGVTRAPGMWGGMCNVTRWYWDQGDGRFAFNEPPERASTSSGEDLLSDVLLMSDM